MEGSLSRAPASRIEATELRLSHVESTLLSIPAPPRVDTGTRESPLWLLSGAADFWLVCAGGGATMLVVALVLLWRGDHELGVADLVLAELHLGATYDAIVRRRLWQRMPVEVVAVPLAILAATYAMTARGWSALLVTIIVYLGAWHRGRQNLGIARHYQRLAAGPVSGRHRAISTAAMYLPMAASLAYFTATSPLHEGEEYLALTLPSAVHWTLAALAAATVVLYLASTTGRHGRRAGIGQAVHPAERWLVVANAVGFGSAYVLGAWMESFVLVLVLHHSVQYLAFTYATARDGVARPVLGVRSNLSLLASFATWPVLGLATWALCRGWDPSESLEPFLTAGLLAHYWLDGRIWTARARRLAAPLLRAR